MTSRPTNAQIKAILEKHDLRVVATFETQGKCPNCKTAVPRISDKKQVWYCFVCHRGGTIFTWVMLARGCGFPKSCEILERDEPTNPREK